jgi:hypothetical protein
MLSPLQASDVFHIGNGVYFKSNKWAGVDGDGTGPTIYVTEPYRRVLTDSGEVKSGEVIIREVSLSLDVFSCLIACMSKRGKSEETWREAKDYLEKPKDSLLM